MPSPNGWQRQHESIYLEIGPTESVTNVIKMSLVPSTFRGDQTNLAVRQYVQYGSE